ncbi:BTB/POZ protein [Rhizophagus clarus]|uniref:BTB/POZ protein n=1 Tax=Rhizophagus clarus TaxID=94130 RepID=A0A8H3LZK8_9GLOM|nr:BTB/POZ protein [Rhizophagus clarus]
MSSMSPEILVKRLIKNLDDLFQNLNINNCDTIIKVGSGLNSKTFFAHSLILTLQSTYFRIALSSDWIKKDGDKIIFEKPNISPKNFEIILKHLYSGTVSLDELTPCELLDLLCATDEFMLTEVLYSKDGDDIDMEEVELWKYVVKWGIHKCSNSLDERDVNEWVEEDFNELWEILKDYVELIRFGNISNEDFSNEVKPYLRWNCFAPRHQSRLSRRGKHKHISFDEISKISRDLKSESYFFVQNDYILAKFLIYK